MTTETPQHIQIPEEIKKDISEKWFHLYTWISPDEVKLSIERDFLHVMKYIWAILAIGSIVSALPFYGDIAKMIQMFLISITIGVFLIFLYLMYLSLKRSVLLSKSAFVVLTDSSISLWGKIVKLSDIHTLSGEFKDIGATFDEELFSESRLSNSKKKLSEQVLAQVFNGYKFLFAGNKKTNNLSFGKWADSEKAILIILALYTMYVGIMSIVYFVAVLFLWIFGKIITWLNTKYLSLRGNTVIQINSLFGKIDILSDDLTTEKTKLKKSLGQAQQNDWKDGLLLEINDSIQMLSTHTHSITKTAEKLKSTISSSRYHDMFRSDIYNGWIKKQVISPLKDIKKLLEKNSHILDDSIISIQKQLQESLKAEFSSPLTLQKKRLEIQKRDIKAFLDQIQNYIEKLK